MRLSSLSMLSGAFPFHPDSVLSIARLLPSAPEPLTIVSMTNSLALLPYPVHVPVPSGPYTNRWLSWGRSEIGMKILQNLSAGPTGGGGVKYAVARCSIRAGGCAMMCVKVGDRVVWVKRDRRGQESRWRTSTDGSGGWSEDRALVYTDLRHTGARSNQSEDILDERECL